eukprot:c8162_g1_i1.p2 GENE.c8162_g1_i1~~c8162_g1_i1.p2  ORF type:complete len:161 (-),score=34.22 c8162_g1_i1:1665-2147(-)
MRLEFLGCGFELNDGLSFQANQWSRKYVELCSLLPFVPLGHTLTKRLKILLYSFSLLSSSRFLSLEEQHDMFPRFPNTGWDLVEISAEQDYYLKVSGSDDDCDSSGFGLRVESSDLSNRTPKPDQILNHFEKLCGCTHEVGAETQVQCQIISTIENVSIH